MSLNYRPLKAIENVKRTYFVDNEHLVYLTNKNELYWMDLKNETNRFLKKCGNFLAVTGHYLLVKGNRNWLTVMRLPSMEKLGVFEKIVVDEDQLIFNSNHRELLLVLSDKIRLIDLEQMKIIIEQHFYFAKRIVPDVDLFDQHEYLHHKETDIIFQNYFSTRILSTYLFDPVEKVIQPLSGIQFYLKIADSFFLNYQGDKYKLHYHFGERGVEECNGTCAPSDIEYLISPAKLSGNTIIGYSRSEPTDLVVLNLKNDSASIIEGGIVSPKFNYEIANDDGKYIVILYNNRLRILERDDGMCYHTKFWKSRDLISIKNETGEFKCNRTLLYEISDFFRTLVEEEKDEEIEIPNEYDMEEVERVLTLRLEKGKLDEENEIGKYFIL